MTECHSDVFAVPPADVTLPRPLAINPQQEVVWWRSVSMNAQASASAIHALHGTEKSTLRSADHCRSDRALPVGVAQFGFDGWVGHACL